MSDKVDPPRRKRNLFRKQAIDHFVQGLESGIPDGTWRPIPGLFISAFAFAALAVVAVI